MKQLTLPGVDMRPICMGCKRPTNLLGQVYPGKTIWLCRACIEYVQPDMSIFEFWDDHVGVRMRRDDELSPQRSRYQSIVNSLLRLRTGCTALLQADWDERNGLSCERDPYSYYSGCRACLKRKGVETMLSLLRRSSNQIVGMRQTPHNRSLPLCQRCGCAHNRLTIGGDMATYCQRCEDELHVESLVRWMFKIKPELGNDDEAALDWLYQTGGKRELFERGVLPDYWYKVRRGL